MKRIRVSYNLKPDTIELIKLASEIFNENMSTIVDNALTFRLNFIINKKGVKTEEEEHPTYDINKMPEETQQIIKELKERFKK